MGKDFKYCSFSEHSIERVPQVDMMKHIEKCGRVCYKSEDKITDESAHIFIENLRKREHYSVLEHGTVYLTVPKLQHPFQNALMTNRYIHNHWSRVTVEADATYITTNYRVLVENGWEEDLKYQVNEPTKYHKQRVTFKFVHDIGIARDSNRHRAHSISEESTRFINYEKRGARYTASPFSAEECEDWDDMRIPLVFENMWMGDHNDEITALDVWMFSCITSTYCYNKLINLGWSPQMARRTLNLGIKTETYYTAYVSEWKEYIRKRVKAHPDLIRLVRQMVDLLRDYLTEEEYNKYVKMYDAELNR